MQLWGEILFDGFLEGAFGQDILLISFDWAVVGKFVLIQNFPINSFDFPSDGCWGRRDDWRERGVGGGGNIEVSFFFFFFGGGEGGGEGVSW